VLLKIHAPQFLYTPTSWFQPLDWTAVFGNANPVEVDLGCGDGTFLVKRAAKHPDHNFLGVERLLGRARKVDRKAQRLELTNVRALRIEVSYAVSFLFPPGSVSVCHLYFPDPWPKKRHHKRRLVQAEFVAALARTLVPTGEVRLATDHDEYFEEMRLVFQASGAWADFALPEPAEDERTDFEQDFVKQGKAIHRAGFRLRGGTRAGLLADDLSAPSIDRS
jgi:tRNA (guanine-N7-)-methyltransferase